MEVNSTQLAVPGDYIPIYNNIIAPSLEQQIEQDYRLLHCPVKGLDHHIFQSTEYTSKVGGLPDWLLPCDEHGVHPINDSNEPNDPAHPSIPTCPSCGLVMVLLAQLFCPVDMIDGEPKPIPSTHTSAYIRSTLRPSHNVTVSRYARSLYVFCCASQQCGNAPGTWRALSMTQSVPKMLKFSPDGSIVIGGSGSRSTKQSLGDNYGHDDDDDDIDALDTSDDDEDEDEDGDKIESNHDDEDVDTNNESPHPHENEHPECNEIPSNMNSNNNNNILPSTTPQKKVLFDMGGWSSDDDDDNDDDNGKDDSKDTNTKPQTASVVSVPSITPQSKATLFSVGEWSDDDDDGDSDDCKATEPCDGSSATTSVDIDKSSSKTKKNQGRATATLDTSNLTKLQQLVDDSKVLASKAELAKEKSDAQKQEKERLRALRRRQQKKLQQQLQFPSSSSSRAPGGSGSIVLDEDPLTENGTSHQSLFFYRPYYLSWYDESRLVKTKKPSSDDYAVEQAMLEKYYAEESNPHGSSSSAGKDLLDGDDFSDDDCDTYDQYGNALSEVDPFRVFQETISHAPEQVIRYLHSNLSLHTIPKAFRSADGKIAQIRKQTSQHPLHQYSTMSGLWLLNDVPKCSTCGSDLTCELQILPTILTDLQLYSDEVPEHCKRLKATLTAQKLANKQQKKSSQSKNTTHVTADEIKANDNRWNVDFGIVNIYTCLNLCTVDDYMTNFCLVQPSV